MLKNINERVFKEIETIEQAIAALKTSTFHHLPQSMEKINMLVLQQEKLQKIHEKELSTHPALSKNWDHKVNVLKKMLHFHKKFTDIDCLIHEIQTFKINPKQDQQLQENELVYKYIKVYDQLFKDSENEHAIGSQLKAENHDVGFLAFHYFKRIDYIKYHVDLLPDNHPYKTLLNNRIIDNCSVNTLKRFNDTPLDVTSDEFLNFLKENSEENKLGTVEVITWGTQDEINNGLRNVLRQKWQGDNVGHAALMMRVPADESGLALIDKYCLNANGTVKIPYEIKQYGNEVVYEIYWSFWPDAHDAVKLNTFKEDIETELGGFKDMGENEFLNSIPSELKAHFVHERYRKNLQGKNEAIIVAPAAIKNVANTEEDEKRNEYLRLKIKKLKINNDISALETLIGNYLVDGKEFSSTLAKEISIKPTSNFLKLIARFKHDLPDSVQNILTKNVITPEASLQLRRYAEQLIEEKRKESLEIKALYSKLGEYIFVKKKNIKSLNKELKDNRIKASKGIELTQKRSSNNFDENEENGLFGDFFQEETVTASAEEITRENKTVILDQIRTLQNIYNEGRAVLISKKNNELANVEKQIRDLELDFEMNSEEWIHLKKLKPN